MDSLSGWPPSPPLPLPERAGVVVRTGLEADRVSSFSIP